MGTIPSLFQENPPAFHLGFTHFPGQIRDHPLVLRRKIGYNETSFRRVCRRYHNENKPVARLWRNQMDNSDWRRIGDQISDTVSRALSSREFREIQGTIQNTVHEIQTAFKNEFSGYAPQTPPAPPPAVPPRKTKARAPGRTAGTLLLVFGAIGFGAAALTALSWRVGLVFMVTSVRLGRSPLPRLVASGPHRLPRPAREEAKARSSPHRAVGFPKPGGRFVLPLSPFLSGGKRNRKSIATLAGRIGRLCEPLMPKEEARRSDRTEPAVPRMPPGGCLRVDCSGEALAGPPGGASPSPS